MYQEFQSKLDYIIHYATLFLLDFGLRVALSELLVYTGYTKVPDALLTVLSCPYRQHPHRIYVSVLQLMNRVVTVFYHKGLL